MYIEEIGADFVEKKTGFDWLFLLKKKAGFTLGASIFASNFNLQELWSAEPL